MIGLTLKTQAVNYALEKGWSTDSANTVAEIAVEVAESNAPIFNTKHFKQVMREAMFTDSDITALMEQQ